MLTLILLGVVAPAARAAVGDITEIPVPHAPRFITAGPDANLWYTATNGTMIGRISTAGVVTEFPIPTPSALAQFITNGPDGNVWFTESSGNMIGRVTPSGTVTEFAIPTANSSPGGIATGPDGNLWFTEAGAATIGRITPSGTITEFPVPTSGGYSVTAGPDGNMWYTTDTNQIGQITTSGVVSGFPIPSGGGAHTITTGPDGNLWFTEWCCDRIARMTTSGSVTEFTLPALGSGPAGIAAGPDGNLWFTEIQGNRVGRITTAGTITEFNVPTIPVGNGPAGMAAGSDGNMWFTEPGAAKVGRISLAAPIVLPSPAVSSFSPLAGGVGTSVTIAGTNFFGASSVRFNGHVQPLFTVDSTGTLITAAVPGGASTGPIEVVTPYGTATSPSSFTVTAVGAHERNVTLSLRRHLLVRGHVLVTDGFAACSQSMNVRIQRRISNHWRTIATDETDANGLFTAQLPDRTGWYRARVNGMTLGSGDVCNRAISGTRHHRGKGQIGRLER